MVAFSVACGLFVAGAVITATLLRSGRLPSDDENEASNRDQESSSNDDENVDVPALKRRIAELETENRNLQQQLHIRTVAAPTPH